MGGLVAKRAYILARQLKEHDAFAQRVSVIFFLATPHRGSNLAETLTRILQVTLGARPFVTDLHPNSTAIQSINDEFPHHCQGLQLYSFYETLQMRIGVKKFTVVPKDSATMGYDNERSMYLQANHREVCKYASKEDPNYLAVRNALASTLEGFRGRFTMKRRETNYDQQRWLNDSMEVYDAPEDDYLRVDSLRIPGSCTWITASDKFQQWRDCLDRQLYWVTAKPGAGKSVLSGYVINHLKDAGHDCAFYFFSFSDKSKSNVSTFLRSVAWQMASMHTEVFDILVKTCKKDPQLAKADYRTIWRKVFLEGVFKVSSSHPQYLVVDALDECKNDSELLPFLFKAVETGAFRVFVTSRSRFEAYGQTAPQAIRIVSEAISQENTNSDIILYLTANINHLPALGRDSAEARESIMCSILEKSLGCFLWVRLVLQEIRRVHTAAEIRSVLEEVPSDMGNLYMRILESMSALRYGTELAKAILTWTVCSARPLSTDELFHAVQIDIKDNVDSVRRSIETSCGQLVYIDSNSRVQMLHQTARDFLLHPENTSEFAINKTEGHRRLAMVCLEYLSGREMAGPRNRKFSAGTSFTQRCDFVAYASESLFEHILLVSSEDDECLTAMVRFLNSSNVLSWIEFIAKDSDLNRLIQTGKAFKNYLQRRPKHLVLLGKDVAMLDAWATDLPRLVTKFGKNLLSSPSSIFHLIPPFCPSEVALRKQFGTSPRAINVSGLSATTWDDCLSTITHQEESSTAVACSALLLAIGFSSGKIMIHNETTCQYLRSLSHGEMVRFLQFSDTGEFLASAGLKAICLWDVNTWESLWKFNLEAPILTMTFVENDTFLLTTLKSNVLVLWNIETGFDRELTSWSDDLNEISSGPSQRPLAAALAKDASLLAVVYRGQDIIMWDVDRDCLYDVYAKETGSLGTQAAKRSGIAHTWSMTFSQAPETGLFVAGFNDGELVLFNTFDGTVQARTFVNAHTLASSPDGLTLACGNSAGTIQLFDFDSLKLLYRIQSQEHGIKSLVFSADSHRLLDIRGPHCRVWDPPVLVRQDFDAENSDTVSISTAPQDYTLDDTKQRIQISALACSDNGDAVFCGKEDGSICLYDSKTGQYVRQMFRHAAGVSIISLYFDVQNGILGSTDSGSRTMAHKLVRQRNDWVTSTKLFDHRSGNGAAVDQILSNTGFSRLLVCSSIVDTLWSIGPVESSSLASIRCDNRRSYRWSTHPKIASQLILITENVAHIYDWQSLRRLTPDEGILMTGSVLPELTIRSIIPCFDRNVFATSFAESLAARSISRLILWNVSDFTPDSSSAAPIPHYQPLADHVEYLIGVYGHRLVFLRQDGWICSADSASFDDEYYDRHFFLPADWLSTTGGMLMEVFKNGSIVFVHRDEVAIIRRGLEHFEFGQSRGLGKRPSLAKTARSDESAESMAGLRISRFASH